MNRDPRLQSWLDALMGTPGITGVGPEAAWEVLVEDAICALPFIEEGPVVDVGSGTGSPGIPVAAARPDLSVTLLDSSRRKCDFLERLVPLFPNVRVRCERAEELGRGDGRDAFAVALARALAPQAVSVEWCAPLVRPGGVVVLYAGEPEPSLEHAARALACAPPQVHTVAGARGKTVLVLRKLAATPDRFPRRPGMARKRPLV